MTRSAVVATMPTLYSPTWDRVRRLAFTWGSGSERREAGRAQGQGNPNYRHGRHSRRRVYLQDQVDAMLRHLIPGPRMMERLTRLPLERRELVTQALGWLTGDCHPDRWMLADQRPGKPARRYCPKIALRFALAWLRKARDVQRAIFFDPALVTSMSAPLHKERGSRGTTGGRRSPADEIRRLVAWSRARGIPWIGGPEPSAP